MLRSLYHVCGPLALVVIPLLLQLPALAHWCDSNPLGILSGIAQRSPGLLPGLPWIDPNYGTTVQALGKLAADTWLRGEIPWWNPYNGVGLPLAAEMQPAALFLPFILLLHFTDGVLYLRILLQIIAGLGTWGLLRQMRLSRAAALLGGLLYACDGTFTWLPDAPCHPIGFLPLILLGVERARQGRGVVWITLGLAGSLYAGFPETAFPDGLLAGVWSLCRLAQASGSHRWGLLRRLLSGVVLSLLLAAPILWPFAEYLSQADVGRHLEGFAHIGLPLPAFALFLLPTLYGPIASFGYSGPDDVLWFSWGQIGGYLGLATSLLALAAVSRRRADPLRWVLLGWLIVCLGKTGNVPGLTELANLVPGLTLAAFFRYGEPSWTFAAIVLAALALDDWRRGALSRAAVWRAGGLSLALALGALALASPVLRHLFLHARGWRPFAAGTLAWAALASGGICRLLLRPASGIRLATLALLLSAETLGFAAFPLLSAPHDVAPDRNLIAFLQTHLGLARFVTLGPLQANLGAFYRLASINARSVPIATIWAKQVQDALHPDVAAEDFGSTTLAGLRTQPEAYARLGTAYVLAPPNTDPLPPRLTGGFAPDIGNVGNVALWLQAGETARGELPPLPTGSLASIGAVAVQIGNLANTSAGILSLTLCTPAACATGHSDALQTLRDNALAPVMLDAPLTVHEGDVLTYRITRIGGANPFALWLWPTPPDQDQHVLGPTGHNAGLGLHLVLHPPGSAAPPVYADRMVEVYALPNPAPYASADTCTLQTLSRTEMTAQCPSPARLIRRELFMPGWQATTNGRATPVEPQEALFQAIALPAGTSYVAFRYAPPFVGWSYLAFGCGVALLGLTLVNDRKKALLF